MRKIAVDIYAVRCVATGGTWAGRAADLDTIWRRLSFELVQRGRRRPSLQAAGDAHGAGAFSFEAIERIEEVEFVCDRKLAARLDPWRRRRPEDGQAATARRLRPERLAS